MPERAGWTGTQVAVLVILLVVTNAVTASVMFFAFPAAPAGPAPLIIYHPWAGAERDLFGPVLEEFTDQTGIVVQDRTFRQEQLQTLLPPQFTAGETPADVIFMASGFIRDWGEEGWAMDISDRIDTADYLEGFIDPVTSGDAIYGSAFTSKPKPGFWYRDSVFTANGWDKNPADYDEFVALLADIMGDGTVPLVSGNGVGWPLSDVTEHFIATYGGAAMHEALTAGTLSWTDASVRTIFTDYLVPLLEAGYFDDPVDWTIGLSNLWAETNAMYFQGSFILGFDQIEDPDDMVSMSLPGGVADAGTVVGADYLFVPTFTSSQTEALQLFDFLTGVDGQEVQIAQGGGHFPTNVNIDPSVAHPCCPPGQVTDKVPLADMDDTKGGTFQTTFWAQLQALWANPASLDTVLAAIDAES